MINVIGEKIEMYVCVIVKVVDGKIICIEEYLDFKLVSKFSG